MASARPSRRPERSAPIVAFFAMALALVLAVTGCAASQAGAPASGASLRPGVRTGELAVDGYLRTWTVYVPPGIARTDRVPLVVMLHGAGSSGDEIVTDWIAEADRRGFIVAAPDGLPLKPDKRIDPTANPRVWNDGRIRGAGPRSRVDDAAFIVKMLDRIDAELPIDTRRTYAAGHSNGGGMAFRLASEASERIAAIAVVASVPWVVERPTYPMPTLVLVGTRDPFVPIEGGIVRSAWAAEIRPSFRVAMERWARELGMLAPTAKTTLDDANVRVEQWTDAADAGGQTTDATLTAEYVKGQGHGWPGGVGSGVPQTASGPAPQTVDATALAWRFFSSAPAR